MPILDEHSLDFVSHSPAQTQRFGARLGALLKAGDLICLEGDLGSGKTCLAQGIGQGMGIAGPITSPTFTLIAEYRAPSNQILYHIDLYRLGAAVDEALAFGLSDYLLGDGVCVVEWADRITAALPNDRLWTTLRYIDPSKRGLMIKATGVRYEKLLRQFRGAAFGI
jgi:tRNA threonylcarbamoyladenosine biosynthesis protein TsaE